MRCVQRVLDWLTPRSCTHCHGTGVVPTDPDLWGSVLLLTPLDQLTTCPLGCRPSVYRALR